MYKNCFEISKQTIRKDTNAHELFFKNYRVFDGCGTVNFWTLQEARNYVMVKSKQMQNIFEYATELFSKLSSYYVLRLIEFRCYSVISQQINTYLTQSLEVLKYMTSTKKDCYMMSKLKCLYSYYLSICKLLNMNVLYNTIKKKCSILFIEYPVFRSSDFIEVKKLNTNQLNINVI